MSPFARIAATGVGLTLALSPVPAAAVDTTPTPATETITTLHTRSSPTKAQRQKAKRQAAKKRADRKRASLVRIALNQKGDRYISGATGPHAFDCSGFTKYVYKQATGKTLPHYSGSQLRTAKRVSLKHLKPGDLMFYGPGGSQHVSMYIGKGKMIHATNPRSGVKVDSIHMGYYKARFAGAGRIVQG
jgi:cell wall-associated NlpC family hydrolase